MSAHLTIERHRRRLALLILAAALLSPGPAASALPDVCGMLVQQAERAQGIPPGLMHAVALAESGRWVAAERTTQAWPWTVTSSSDHFFLPSMAGALQKVRELQAMGRSNIDVGCMQVNLGYHGHAFASVAEALEPATNVAYAARFLKQLREETRSWDRATARYHSADPARGKAYRDRVYRLWHQLRRRRVADRAPTRVAGSPLVAGARAPLLERSKPRLIMPGLAGDGGAPLPGAIPVLRGN